MAGGYREGSGRSKTGYYAGMYLGSTYELCWAIYNLDHNIPFERFPGKLTDGKTSYYPDFLLGDGITIVECKGYEHPDKVRIKTLLAESLGYNVSILRKADLKFAFDYVKEKYATDKFHILYDGYKPEYKYVCEHCKKEFGTDIKKKTITTFCCRSCAGLYRRSSNSELPSRKYKNRKTNKDFNQLTKDVALDIFNTDDLSYSELSIKYGVSKSMIGFIKTKKSYKWIHI